MDVSDYSNELQTYLLGHGDDLLAHIIRFNELMMRYQAAIKEVSTKLEILKSDFQLRNQRSSIESIQSRFKKPASILKKLSSRGIEVNLETIRTQLSDVAGIRVICPFIDDIYQVTEQLAIQDDIRVLRVKDYIQNPKPNGYRSYHMILEVPVFFMDNKELMQVEVQFRTVAMDFWASLEHQIKYKKDIPDAEELVRELKSCADTIAETDRRKFQFYGMINKKTTREVTRVKEDRAIHRRISEYACAEPQALRRDFQITSEGYAPWQVEDSRRRWGANVVAGRRADTVLYRLRRAFVTPFSMILLVLAVISFVTDVLLASNFSRNLTTVFIVLGMLLISDAVRFVQELRAKRVADHLTGMIVTRREQELAEIPLDELVVGDIVHLSAGDMIPADLRILEAKDLFLSQASLTGESEPEEKTAAVSEPKETITDHTNIAFMVRSVVSGSATAVAVCVGDNTLFGSMAIAVGLTPEMLPMIVTTCLAKGAVSMSKKKTIFKNLNSIQNFGAIDVLCTDKTGTLTQDQVVLEYHRNLNGEEDTRVLRHAYLNSYFQTSYKNLMDLAIIRKTEEQEAADPRLLDLSEHYVKVDEIPFDFARRRLTTVVQDKTGKTQMVTKGAVEEMLAICSHAECDGTVQPLTGELRRRILQAVDEMNDKGFRVLAIAQKSSPAPAGAFGVKDEQDMVLMGYLAFLDPPKESTAAALRALKVHGVTAKILTGDNEKVTLAGITALTIIPFTPLGPLLGFVALPPLYFAFLIPCILLYGAGHQSEKGLCAPLRRTALMLC